MYKMILKVLQYSNISHLEDHKTPKTPLSTPFQWKQRHNIYFWYFQSYWY